METKFECSYEANKENVREYLAYYHFRSPYFLLPLLTMLCILVKAAFDIVHYGWQWHTAWPLVLAVVLIPALLLYRYHRDVKTRLARSREMNGDKPGVTMSRFSEDTVTLTDSLGNTRPVAYSNLKQVVITRNLLLVQTKARQVILCEKERFTTGTWSDCVTFLQQKGLKTKKG